MLDQNPEECARLHAQLLERDASHSAAIDPALEAELRALGCLDDAR